MSTTPPPTPPTPMPTPQMPAGATTPVVAAKKSKTLFWVLGGCGTIIVLCIVVFVGIFFFTMHKIKQAGLEDLMKKNPALAAAEIAVFINPDLEKVSSNDDAGTLVVRDKKTGKVTTLKFDVAKKTMVVIDNEGKTASITANTETGNLEMRGPEGTIKIGANADKAPEWVPVYPGSSPQSTMSVNANGNQSGTYVFVTQDASDKVLSFYGDEFKASGMTASTTSNNTNGKVSGIVSGADQEHKRTALVTVSSDADGVHVSVTFEEKKSAN